MSSLRRRVAELEGILGAYAAAASQEAEFLPGLVRDNPLVPKEEVAAILHRVVARNGANSCELLCDLLHEMEWATDRATRAEIDSVEPPSVCGTDAELE